jgi:hypothetical protein
MLLFDLKKDFKNLEPYWRDCINYIRMNCQSDKLYKNYLDIDLHRFLSMGLIIEDNKIISFGGAEINHARWGTGLSRVLSRFWIHPDYRHKIVQIENTQINYSPLILKINLEELEKQEFIKAAMITREGVGIHGFSRIVAIANTATTKTFHILEGKYNVCGQLDIIPDPCQQMIAMSILDDSLDLEIFLKDLEENTYFRKC